MTLTVKLKGFDQLDQALRRLAAVGRPGSPEMRGILTALGSQMQHRVAETFRDQKDPVTGAAWKPTGALALSTRAKGGAGGKTLIDHPGSGLMSSVVTSKPVVSANTVAIGTNLRYAPIHNEGGTISAKGGKFLAIPLTRKARVAERARRWWKQNAELRPFILWTAGGSSANKKAGSIVTRSENGDLVFHWALFKQVKIPQRRFLGFAQNDAERYADTVELAIETFYEGKG